MADNPAVGVVHLVRALTVELDLAAAAFASRHGLHATDLRALIWLLDAGRAGTDATPGRLGAGLRLSSASTTALVDRLTGRGLVRRDHDPVDRRRVLLTVTTEARRLGEDFFGPLIGRAVASLESDLTTAEQETVDRALRGLVAAVRDDQAADPPQGPSGGSQRS